MFPNVYLPVQEVTVGIQTDFEDKCRWDPRLSLLQGEAFGRLCMPPLCTYN